MVAAGAARRFELQIAYAIGVSVPVAVYVDTFGTGVRSDQELASVVREVFDFRPRAITDRLGLEDPIFFPTSAYGHFGRTPRRGRSPSPVPAEKEAKEGRDVELFTWERTDRVEEIRDKLAL
jgi:S-adenosylmethionine synthetase